jgi:LysR family hydrogen peroxide-inducible transcriptional activator
MELADLRGALVVAEERSLRRAAARLAISTRILADRLAGLERELGLVIFVCDGETCRPTPQGQRFLEEATRILTRPLPSIP